ncbi:hypothetical protein [Rhodospirillum centenum]|uniref:Uncharacterized protein n=1 Tax=Rhodospirillum centenum (strain ATCC 51521 / SW) TaxID=414684 RepID=B6IWD5_RHOCS|nr:hypothetical protein [Rhodospirillum centenum]ACJ00609.1 hypothetical protein RC1_3247 [Rhodospirillum centenum SW]
MSPSASTHTPGPGRPVRLPIGKLPFVGVRRDGQLGFWVLPPQAEDADLRLAGRTYAAWFLLYAEVNGQAAARDLLDRIEREMPSRYARLDRAFLAEIGDRGYALSAA